MSWKISKKLQDRFWDYYLRGYDILLKFPPYLELIEDIMSLADPKPGEKILEAGCGTGNIVIALLQKEKNIEVYGIDKEPIALNITLGKLKKIGLEKRTRLVLGDISDALPYESNFFEKVICNNTLYAIPSSQQKGVIKEFYGVLKNEGVLILGNLKPDWSFLGLYIYGVKKNVEREGLVKSLLKVVYFGFHTAKMLLFNILIKKKSQHYFASQKELKDFVLSAGFETFEITLSYGGQSFLVKAKK